MGKLTTFLMVMTGLSLVFYFTGIINQESTLLTLLLNPESFGFQSLVSQALVAFSISGVAGVVVGIVTKNYELVAASGFIIWIMNLMFGFVDVYRKLAAENKVLAIVFFGPILFMFVITTVEWWRGRD